MTCFDCKHKSEVDLSGAFSDYIGICRFTNTEIDYRTGCDNHKAIVKEDVKAEIEPDGQMRLF